MFRIGPIGGHQPFATGIHFGDAHLRLLSTNDTEGNLYNSASVISSWKKLRKQAEDKGQDVLTLHAGDMTIGQDDAANDRVRELWQYAGLDAFVPGNHDFDAPNCVNAMLEIDQAAQKNNNRTYAKAMEGE